MSRKTLNLTDDLYAYMLNNSLRETPALRHCRLETAKMESAVMQISPEQGQFMALLAELLGARKVIEIGTYTGYSALAVAQTLPADGKLIACDVSEDWTAMAQQFWQQAGVAHKIDLRIGPASKTLADLIGAGQSGQFDFIFIDADKSSYPDYYEKSLALLRTGGLILLDNVFLDADVADVSKQNKRTCVMRELNQQLLQDERVSISMIPVSDGLTLARKR